MNQLQNLGFLLPLSTTLRLVNYESFAQKNAGKHGFDMDSPMEHGGKMFGGKIILWVYQENKDRIRQLTFMVVYFYLSNVKTPNNIITPTVTEIGTATATALEGVQEPICTISHCATQHWDMGQQLVPQESFKWCLFDVGPWKSQLWDLSRQAFLGYHGWIYNEVRWPDLWGSLVRASSEI